MAEQIKGLRILVAEDDDISLIILMKTLKDAGHTVVEPGTITCLGIGPDSEEKIDRITGKLKMV